jgi:hypothetical protein
MDSLQFLIILCYRNYEYLFHGYYQNLLVAGIFFIALLSDLSLRLEYQRITAQQTQFRLMLSCGSSMAHIVHILN